MFKNKSEGSVYDLLTPQITVETDGSFAFMYINIFFIKLQSRWTFS